MSLRKIGFIAFCAFAAVLGALYAQLVMSPDQATFAYVGWRAAEGARYYVEVGEQNWPGAMWLHELAIRVFGPHVWSWKLLEYIIALAGAASLVRLAPDRDDDWQAAALLFLYPAVYTTADLWFGGQRDIVAGHILLVGAAAFLARLRGGPAWTLVIVAGTLFISTLLRPTYLLYAAVLIGVAALTRKETGATWRQLFVSVAITLAAFFGMLGATLAWGHHTGGLEGWWAQSVLYNLSAYKSKFAFQQLLFYLRVWWPLLPVSAFGFVLAWRRAKSRVGLLAVFGLAFTGLVSYVVMGKGFGYHLGAVHTAMVVGVCFAVARALPDLRRADKRRGVATVILLFTALGVGRRFADAMDEPVKWALGLQSKAQMRDRLRFGDHFTAQEAFEIAALAKAAVPEGGTLLAGTPMPLINFLAQRPLPYRFATTSMLEQAAPPFPYAEAWQKEALEALEAHPPGAIVLLYMPDGERHFARKLETPTPFTRWLDDALENDYVELERRGDLRLYVPRSHPGITRMGDQG